MQIKYTFLTLIASTLLLFSCNKNDGVDDDPTALRQRMDYGALTFTTEYTEAFKDRGGNSTVEMAEAHMLSDMLSDLDLYMKTVTESNPSPLTVHATDMYANQNNPFGPARFNTSGISLRSRTALSYAGAIPEEERSFLNDRLNTLIAASQQVGAVAAQGHAGRINNTYLLDARGIEQGQVLQKGIAGAVLLDQIVNVYLSESFLNGENDSVVAGKLYTPLEHNWDMAFGLFTPNERFGVVDGAGNSRERFIGSYLIEYNPTAVQPVYLAFLKGRAAIVNRDPATWREQASLIRTELEKTIALNAIANLEKWKANTSPAIKAHAYAEALGHVYTLRYCKKSGTDRAWAQSVWNGLETGNGFWSLTEGQVDAAISAIKNRFGMVG